MDRKDFFKKQRVTQAEVDAAFAYAEQAGWNDRIDDNISGVITGMVPTLGSAPNVNITKGVALDQAGKRIKAYTDGASTKSISYATDTLGNATSVTGGQERWIAVYCRYGRQALDPRVDGDGNTVYFDQPECLHDGTTGPGGAGVGGTGVDKYLIESGTSATTGTATKPALRTDAILICDIKRTPSDASNVLDTSRRMTFAISDATQPGTGNGLAIIMSAFSAWAGGRTNPAQPSLHAQIDKIFTDLAATTASDDGAERIGASAGAGALSSGSVRSQLDTLDTRSHMTADVNYLGGRVFTKNDSVQTIVATLIADLAATTASDDGAERVGAESHGTLTTGSVRSQLNQLEDNKAGYTVSQTWTAKQTMTESSPETTPIEFGGTVAGATPYRLIWQTTNNASAGGGALDQPAIRFYLRAGTTVGSFTTGNLVITLNAKWVTDHWVADMAGDGTVNAWEKALRVSFGGHAELTAPSGLGFGVRMFWKTDTTSTWNDGQWDNYISFLDSNLGANKSPTIVFGGMPAGTGYAQMYVDSDVPKFITSGGVVKTFTIT